MDVVLGADVFLETRALARSIIVVRSTHGLVSTTVFDPGLVVDLILVEARETFDHTRQ